MRGWLRRNRWGLLALPVTVALAVGTNSQRLQDYWWDQELRNAVVTAEAGEWLTFDSPSETSGVGSRKFRMRVTGAEQTGKAEDSSSEPEELELPPELVGMRIDMEFEAAPDQVLFGCRMALLDDDGNRYSYLPGLGGVLQNNFACVPYDNPGPQPSLNAGEPPEIVTGGQRPPRWRTRPVVVVPRDARITQVLMWWEQPDYLAVDLN